MITMKIKLTQDSAGALAAEFLDGLDSISQNNAGNNVVEVVPKGVLFEQGAILQIAFSTSENTDDVNAESIGFTNMYFCSESGTWKYTIKNPNLLRRRGAWLLDLRIVSDYVETVDDSTGDVTGGYYANVSNLKQKLGFKVNATLGNTETGYPTAGDVYQLYLQALDIIKNQLLPDAIRSKLTPFLIQKTDEDGNVWATIVLGAKNPDGDYLASLQSQTVNLQAWKLDENGEKITTAGIAANGNTGAVEIQGKSVGVKIASDSIYFPLGKSGVLALTGEYDEIIEYLKSALVAKYDKAGGTISGDVAIQGSLSVSGTTTTKDTETVQAESNILVTNKNGVDLIDLGGFAVKTDTINAYGIMYDPVGDGVKIGLGSFDENGKFTFLDGEAQFLATRADEIADGNLVKWDAEKRMFVDSGVSLASKADKTDLPEVLRW